jgi:hypothetical protein
MMKISPYQDWHRPFQQKKHEDERMTCFGHRIVKHLQCQQQKVKLIKKFTHILHLQPLTRMQSF